MGQIGTLIEEAGTRGTPPSTAEVGTARSRTPPDRSRVVRDHRARGLAARQQLPLHAGDRHLPGHRRRAGRAAGRGDDDPRVGDAADGPQARPHPPAAGRRDARINDGHLHGQDRDAHTERDDGACRATRRPSGRGHRDRVHADGRIPR